MQNIADLVTAAAQRSGGHLALVDATAGTSCTWAELDAAVDAQARALIEAGVRPGDRVVVRLPTSTRFAVGLFGALRAGAVAVPANPDTPGPEIAHVLADSGVVALVGEPVDGVTVVPPAEPGVAGEPVTPTGGGEDLAVLAYTSGTSGAPRGVMLSHRALLSNVDQCAALRPPPVTHTDRVLLVIPMYHSYGLGPGLLQTAAAAATAVLLERFELERVLAVCAEQRITTIVGVPAMYAALAAVDPERLAESLASARLLTSGAAPLPEPVWTAIRAATGLGVHEGYGLTETGPVLTSSLASGFPKPGSVGGPLPGVELRLVDNDGSDIAEPTDDEDDFGADYGRGGTGRVSARGANLFRGYWPDGAHGPDADGWFTTGDVGYLDDDGDLHLVDRANDLIIVNGFNVYPHEVERALVELDGVAEAAAVGVPDERTGERVKAVVVTRPGVSLAESVVIEHCAARLARFKVPAVVEFADALPHTVTGKVQRVRLRGVDTVDS